jgi:hypothetical protein
VIPDKAPDHHLPPELLAQIEAAHAPVIKALHRRLNTPVEGNPYGGFPGINLADHKQMILSIRQELIDKWNAENPNHEFVAPEPLEKPLTPQETEAKIREARAEPRMMKIDKAHDAHIEEVLKDHPEEHHEGLREFIRHEQTKKYFERAEALGAIKAKGKDPHNLMHRYEHHKEMTANGTDTGN